jgi:hypothetical protein
MGMIQTFPGRPRFPTTVDIHRVATLAARLGLIVVPIVLAACNKNGGGPGY